MRARLLALVACAPLAAVAQTPGVSHGGGACTTEEDCSLGGTCEAGACKCDPWFTGPTCVLLNLQAPDDNQHGTCGHNFDSYFSWGGRALPAAAASAVAANGRGGAEPPRLGSDGQWHLYASFICTHDTLSKWTTQSSSAHFVAAGPTGPFEFSPEQCDGNVCTPAVIPWSHNTVIAHNTTASRAAAAASHGDEWQIYHIGDGRVNASVWSPCFNKSEDEAVPLRAAAPRCSAETAAALAAADAAGVDAEWARAWAASSSLETFAAARAAARRYGGDAAAIERDFDCTPFDCTCEGFAEYYAANPGRPNFGYGCAPSPEGPAWYHAQNCTATTKGTYCGGPVCANPALRHNCDAPPANPGAEVFLATAASPNGPWTRARANKPLDIVYNPNRSVWPQSATNPSPLILENGTMYLYFTSADAVEPCGLVSNCVGMAVSENGYEGPFQAVQRHLTYPESEDPTVFRDPRGNFHMLTNVNTCHAGMECGGHAWSRDGLTWTNLTVGAFGPAITFRNGTVWRNAYAERPLVAQAADGTPIAFYVGLGRTQYMDCCNWGQLFCTGAAGEVCGPTTTPPPNGTA